MNRNKDIKKSFLNIAVICFDSYSIFFFNSINNFPAKSEWTIRPNYFNSPPLRGISRHRFRAEKRTAQLSKHPQPYVRARVIIRTAMVERTADCNNKGRVRKNFAEWIYSQDASINFFNFISMLRKVWVLSIRPNIRFKISGIPYDEWNGIFRFVEPTRPRPSRSKFRAEQGKMW